MTSPTTPNVRLTISVSPKVHETFQRLAKVSSMSTGRAMGDWLGDTIEGAEYLAMTMEKARAAPRLVAQELHAYALGLADEMQDVVQTMRKKGEADRTPTAIAGGSGRLPPSPPSSNTGGKVPKRAQQKRGGVA
jgi:hypothetical protein